MSTEYLILRLDQQQTKAEVAFKVPCFMLAISKEKLYSTFHA